MTTLNMNEETLVNLTEKILNEVEKLVNCNYSSKDIENKLEENLGYSLQHIKNVFSLSTGMGLGKYIKRRLYTVILIEIGEENFNKLTSNKSEHNIVKFKQKCLQEFPFLKNYFDTNKMQHVLSRKDISKLAKENLEVKHRDKLIKSLFKKNAKDMIILENSNFKIDKLVIKRSLYDIRNKHSNYLFMQSIGRVNRVNGNKSINESI